MNAERLLQFCLKGKKKLGRKWHLRVEENHETCWCEITKVLCVLVVLGITHRSFRFTASPGAPKAEMQIALSIPLACSNYQAESVLGTQRASNNFTTSTYVSDTQVTFTLAPAKPDNGTCICIKALHSGI